MSRTQIFVSYSHADAEHLQRLRVHLRPFERQRQIDVWADTRISPGSRWRTEIRNALDRAAVAVLLVTADFLASDFIADNELPPLLLAARQNGVAIIPIILKSCAFVDTPDLSEIQAINDPRRPLISLSENEREDVWCNVARTVRNELAKIKPMSFESLAMGNVGITSVPPSQTSSKIPSGASLEVYYGMFGEELRDPSVVDEYSVYSYQFLDDLSFTRPAIEVLGSFESFQELMRRMENRFRKAGWEGDGVISLVWLPPFVGAGMEDTHGLGLWHVKQSNNGISWIASPVTLPFARLLEQNERR